jgi:hypothetical protein
MNKVQTQVIQSKKLLYPHDLYLQEEAQQIHKEWACRKEFPLFILEMYKKPKLHFSQQQRELTQASSV